VINCYIYCNIMHNRLNLIINHQYSSKQLLNFVSCPVSFSPVFFRSADSVAGWLAGRYASLTSDVVTLQRMALFTANFTFLQRSQRILEICSGKTCCTYRAGLNQNMLFSGSFLHILLKLFQIWQQFEIL
jgi:hypothetical protein